MATILDVPAFDAFMQPIVECLKKNGGSMTNQEMAEEVPILMGLADDVRAVVHGQAGQVAVDYRMAWARSYLKKVGALENSSWGVWSLTPKGAAMTPTEIAGVKKVVLQVAAAERAAKALAQEASGSFEGKDGDVATPTEIDRGDDWKEQLLTRLRELEPSAFERLSQRLLREYGFIKVEVTGKSGDGGIDGTGVLRVNLLSFHVLFQCKRYTGSVGAGAVRDFRGAMVGRADKGLIITTGTFTPDARREATRDGAPAIDLVDGETLCDLLKDRKLGVSIRMVEEVTLDEDALASL